MVDTELQQEAQYLQLVYNELLQTEAALITFIHSVTQEGRSELQTGASELRLNFDSMLDNLDTFSMIESKNREIDQLNIKLKQADTQLQNVLRLKKAPYFGKIDVDFLDGEPVEAFYLGVNSFTSQAGDTRVYDWRSPIAELFYNNELGPSAYRVRDTLVHTVTKNRRQFMIEGNHLLHYFDTTIAIQDDILLTALEEDHTASMKDITATIQAEQNTIIRDTQHQVVLVNGVAGSGKTSTIMQRAAFLLYSLKEKITSEDLFILSPNRGFSAYISDVLPNLGEKNPRTMTLLQLVTELLPYSIESEGDYFQRISQPFVSSQNKVLRGADFSQFLAAADTSQLQLSDLFKDITHKNKRIIAKDMLLSLFEKTPHYPNLIDRIQATKKLLFSYWEQEIRTQAKSPAIQEQLLSLSEELQQAYFGELIADDSEEQLYRYGRKLLRRTYQKVTEQIQQLDWLAVDTLFQQLFQQFTHTNYQWTHTSCYTLDEAVALLMVQHTFCQHMIVPQTKFLFVDEVQDYTAAQLLLLTTLFPKSQLTLVGDENQAVFNSASSFDELTALVNPAAQSLQQYNLLNSYRSSGAITKLFSQLASTQETLQIVPVRPDGPAPEFVAIADVSDLLHHIPTTGAFTILTKTAEEAAQITRFLTKQQINPAVAVLPVSLSKGLEFDRILVYNASAENYQTPQDKRILYTLCSRGMHTITITYQGQLTDFLKHT